MKVSKELEPIVKKLQKLQQQLDILAIQKQNFMIELNDVENALKEIELSPESNVYEIIGNIMIKKNRTTAVDKLSEKKRLLTIRQESVEKQAKRLSEEAVNLQKKILEARQKEEK